MKTDCSFSIHRFNPGTMNPIWATLILFFSLLFSQKSSAADPALTVYNQNFAVLHVATPLDPQRVTNTVNRYDGLPRTRLGHPMRLGREAHLPHPRAK